MLLCLDIDGVVADIAYELDFIAIRDGHDKYDFSNSFDSKHWRDVEWVYEAMQDEVFWRNLRPYEDAWHFVNKAFMSGVDVMFVTSRNPKWRDATERWLDEWDIAYHDILFTEAGRKPELLEMMQENVPWGETALMVEDNSLEVDAVNEAKLLGVLMNRDYNKDFELNKPWWSDSKLDNRVDSFSDLEELLNKLGWE